MRSIGASPDELRHITLFAGRGCEECRFTGYGGRTGIFEYLPVDDDIRAEITKKSSTDVIKKVALKKGMMTLRQDGWTKVKQGITTISEVLRVTLEQ
jgi:type II secretory ATPase GspE/PulE/Tfp pilus assembly ATPase PilB-like protein